MKPVLGLVAGACIATLVACGARKMSGPSPTTAADPSASSPLASAGNVREEIAALDKKIDADRAALGLPPATPAACAALPNGCTEASPSPLSVTPVQDDPTCKPSPSDTCKDACTLSDSICTSSARICELASQLGGGDAYANEACERGKASCTASRERCCGCL